MSDYIKREDAIKAFKRVLDEDFPYISEETPRERIAAIPSADVVEVRHGRWLRVGQSFIDPNKFLCFECSICRCTLDNHIKVEPNYCPNCGARMDGEEE